MSVDRRKPKGYRKSWDKDRLATGKMLCELESHRERKEDAPPAVGFFQVYCDGQPTMTRPAALCQRCVDYSKECGMDPRKVADV